MRRYVVGVDSPAIPEDWVFNGLEWLLPRPGELKVVAYQCRKLSSFVEGAIYQRAEEMVRSLRDEPADVYIGVATGLVAYRRSRGGSGLLARFDCMVAVHATGMVQRQELNPRHLGLQLRGKAGSAFDLESVFTLKSIVSQYARMRRFQPKTERKALPPPR